MAGTAYQMDWFSFSTFSTETCEVSLSRSIRQRCFVGVPRLRADR
jgi:hypothetical protein